MPTTGSETFFGAPVVLVSVFRQPPSPKVMAAKAIKTTSVLALLPYMFTSSSSAPPRHQDHGVTVAFKGPKRTVAIDSLQHEACLV